MSNENSTRDNKGRGGRREGAGRPKGTTKYSSERMSQDIKNDIFKTLQERVEDGQRSFAELLVDLAYNRQTAPSLKICALKLISEAITIKEEKSTQEVNTNAVVILPEIITPNE